VVRHVRIHCRLYHDHDHFASLLARWISALTHLILAAMIRAGQFSSAPTLWIQPATRSGRAPPFLGQPTSRWKHCFLSPRRCFRRPCPPQLAAQWASPGRQNPSWQSSPPPSSRRLCWISKMGQAEGSREARMAARMMNWGWPRRVQALVMDLKQRGYCPGRTRVGGSPPIACHEPTLGESLTASRALRILGHFNPAQAR
jgi:hypothetical protein